MDSVTPWSATASFLTFSSSSLDLPKYQTYTFSNPRRLVCQCQSASNDLQFVLHDALDASGVDTNNARAARKDFCSGIARFTTLERQTSICNRGVDLGTMALQIAAEDHSLLSRFNIPFPVDTFVDRLDDLSIGYFPHHNFSGSPEDFIGNLESYLYVDKGFQRKNVTNQSEPRALYLHSVCLKPVILFESVAAEILTGDPRRRSTYLQAKQGPESVSGVAPPMTKLDFRSTENKSQSRSNSNSPE